MAKDKDLKKVKRRVRLPKGQFVQSFDNATFKRIYEAWKEEIGGFSIEEVAMKGKHTRLKHDNNTLLDVIWNHGKVGRTNSTKGPVDPPAGGRLKDKLDSFIDGKAGIEKEDVQFMHDELIYVTSLFTTPKKNPSHIEFHVPVWESVNRKTLEHDVEAVYGHYRTPDYIKYRNLKAKVKDNDKYAETVQAAEKGWYSSQPGKAKPPMWQALFSKGGDDIVSEGKGLMKILQAAKQMIADTVIDFLLVIVEDQGTADEIWEIPHLKEEILKRVWKNGEIGGTPNPEGIAPATGHFRDWTLWKWFNAEIWTPDNIKESNAIKEVIDAEEYKGKVNQYKLKVSRRQFLHIGILCGLKWKKRGQTVWLPKKEDKKEVGDDEKEAMDFSKSWKEVLVW